MIDKLNETIPHSVILNTVSKVSSASETVVFLHVCLCFLLAQSWTVLEYLIIQDFGITTKTEMEFTTLFITSFMVLISIPAMDFV